MFHTSPILLFQLTLTQRSVLQMKNDVTDVF